MRLTCTHTPEIIYLLTAIAEKKGEAKGHFLNSPDPDSIEENRIDSVHASHHLQNRSLKRETCADIIRDQSVSAPRDMIYKIKNTLRVHERLSSYNPLSQDALKQIYSDLQRNKDAKAAYRKDYDFFYYGTGYTGMSMSADEMRKGMKELFHYLRYGSDSLLIKSCICHFAIHYYRPFKSDNEIISRLWQTRLLMEEHPVFEFLPWEKELLPKKNKYYSKLPTREMITETTEFVKYMLEIINNALGSFLVSCRKSIKPIDRIRYFYTLSPAIFTRKDYMLVHKNISASTASRDLDLGVETGFYNKHGEHNKTNYTCQVLFE